MSDLATKVTPPLKWAGGKRWFVRNHLSLFPLEYDTYFEPFFGGGAVLFSLLPEKATISDVNLDLIRTYRAIQFNFEGVEDALRRHANEHSDEYFYSIRSNRPEDPLELAAWFLYLNRTCYNGLYRVNKKGQFNVPRGTKNDVLLPSDNFESVAKALDGCEILYSDFEPVIEKSRSGDFVFLDPPYTVKHNNNGFIKYNENLFSWDDQVRLSRAVARAEQRGVKLLVSNADHQSVRQLYEGIGETLTLDRHSVIGGGAGYRSNTSEIVVKVGY